MRRKHTIPRRPAAVYMKVSISYLITFIVCCGLSLVIDRPGRPVAVHETLLEEIRKGKRIQM